MNALYYPFHLCRQQTLHRLLTEYKQVHFCDFMALQLTPMIGTLAVSDRMGDYFPEFLQTGRIVQGYQVSGGLSPEIKSAVNGDLADDVWRGYFHESLANDRLFRRGLFGFSHTMRIGSTVMPGPAAFLSLIDQKHEKHLFTVENLQALGLKPLFLTEGYAFEYGFALVKTSAVLRYTLSLSRQHQLVPVTDSRAHFRLLNRIFTRDEVVLNNQLIKEEGD